MRTHNEWFRTVMGRRKSCPTCKTKLPTGESIWSWGQYICGKWNTVRHFCRSCYQQECLSHLKTHQDGCGCEISLVPYSGEEMPKWLTLTTEGD